MTKWREGDEVRWLNETVWTIQPGACVAGPHYVLLTAPGYSAVVHQDQIVLARP